MVTVRPAAPSDAPAMGRVHVRAWQRAYRGQMPDDYLDGLAADDRVTYWTWVLERPGDPGVLVAEHDGAVVGFASVGEAREPAGAGELYALNVDPDHWGRGAGPALLEEAQGALARRGFIEAVLWVLPGNARARRFYERAGWEQRGDAPRTVEVLGVVVTEVGYRRTLVPPGPLAGDPD